MPWNTTSNVIAAIYYFFVQFSLDHEFVMHCAMAFNDVHVSVVCLGQSLGWPIKALCLSFWLAMPIA